MQHVVARQNISVQDSRRTKHFINFACAHVKTLGEIAYAISYEIQLILLHKLKSV